MSEDKYKLHENPNCRFYLNNLNDDSKIWVNGGSLYCVNNQCIEFDSKGRLLEFDEFQHSLKGCLAGASIDTNGEIPINSSGEPIDLEAIKGVRGFLQGAEDSGMEVVEWNRH